MTNSLMTIADENVEKNIIRTMNIADLILFTDVDGIFKVSCVLVIQKP